MNRRAPLILVVDSEMVSSGLWPDRHPLQTPLWERADFAQFSGGKVKRRVPNALAFDAGADPVRGIGQQQASNGTRWVWAASGGRIVRWYGPPLEEITTGLNFRRNQTPALLPTVFDFTAWGNWTIINSEDNGARIYRPSPGNGLTVLANAPTDAVQFLKKRNQLLAIGHGLNKRLVSFSDADSIEEWAATPTNLAGEIPLEELNTPVRAACHFGPAVAVFGENQMFAVSWIGAPFYYGQQKLLDGIGAVGKMAVCSDARIIYGVSRNGVWKTDGTAYTYIDEVILRDYLQENINWHQAGKIVCQKNDVTGCIEFSFPMGESLDNNEGWAYDPRYGGWSKVPSFEYAAPRVLLNRPLVGQPDGNVQLLEYDELASGDLHLETRALLIQQDNNALHIGALIDEVEVMAHKANNVQVQYGVAEYPDGPWTWTRPFELTRAQTTYQPVNQIAGTYHKLRFTNYEQEWNLDLQGFALFGVIDGQRREAL